MKEIILSKKYSIWRGTYEGSYETKDFLRAVEINKIISIPTNNNSIWVEFNSVAFQSVNVQVKTFLSSKDRRVFKNSAEHFWVYTQTKDYNQDWMHQHLNVHPGNRSKVKTDYSFTFYINQLGNLKNDQGMIVFKTEDDKIHKFLLRLMKYFYFLLIYGIKLSLLLITKKKE